MTKSTPRPASYDEWLDETFGRAVSGDNYPQFIERDVEDWPEQVPAQLALEYLTRLFERPEESLRYYSDRQIAAGLWELGPGDSHCVYDRDLPVEGRLRLIGSVATFFRDIFDQRCLPRLSHAAKEHISPLNTICYMWWEVISWAWMEGDPNAERLRDQDLDVMERVVQLRNPACREAALHGLGHLVHSSDQAGAIIDRFLAEPHDASPELLAYARAARGGCIQ